MSFLHLFLDKQKKIKEKDLSARNFLRNHPQNFSVCQATLVHLWWNKAFEDIFCASTSIKKHLVKSIYNALGFAGECQYFEEFVKNELLFESLKAMSSVNLGFEKRIDRRKSKA